MDKHFVGLSDNISILAHQPTQSHVEGYCPHEDIEKSNTFPKCCDFHSETYKLLEKWFAHIFPLFTKEMEVKYKSWFEKSDYKGLPLKIVTQISYTEYFIKEKINSTNWYDDIRHYIDYNIWCLGQLQFGSGEYVFFVQKSLQKNEINIVGKKRDKIIAYCNQKLSLEFKTVAEQDITDINVISETIQKWSNIFPFYVEEFSKFKELYKGISVIITGYRDYNPYTEMFLVDIITKSELINLLIRATKDLLKLIDGAIHVKNGESIQKINKYQHEILVESHTFMQQKLLNDFCSDEYTYISILEKWFDKEKVFLGDYLESKSNAGIDLSNNSKYTYLRTFKTSFSNIQLEGLRILLLEKLYISEISNDDFLYLFQNRPVVPSMNKLIWLRYNSRCHYMLKEMVFVGIEFNLKQVNSCIVGYEGKKIKSNSNKGGYKEIDDILNLLRK
jgi:hypothetical protein